MHLYHLHKECIKGINGWEQEFDDRFYIRSSVKQKQINKKIGTIEIAPIRGTATINVKNSHMTIFISKYCHINPIISFVMSQNIKSIVLCHQIMPTQKV